MSEKKLYAVKTDEGEFLSFSDDGDSVWNKAVGHFETDKQKARSWAYNRGGYVVAFVEEPKKVVLTKEQAEIVEEAHAFRLPATSISENTVNSSDLEKLLMNAYVNGYTVAKEKKYLLPMDGTLEENDDNDNFQLYAYCQNGRWLADEVETDPSYKHHTVTQKELETAPAWVKAIKPLEVTDDDDEV